MAHCRLNYKDLHYKEDPGREAEVGKRDALRSVEQEARQEILLCLTRRKKTQCD